MQRIFMKSIILLSIFLSARAVEEELYSRLFPHIEECMCDKYEQLTWAANEVKANVLEGIRKKELRINENEIIENLKNNIAKKRLDALEEMIQFNKETDIIARDMHDSDNILVIVTRSKQELEAVTQKIESARELCKQRAQNQQDK